MTAKKTTENQEFQYLPMKSIILEKQIRSTVDKTTESFKALVLWHLLKTKVYWNLSL
jgi:hypothetical protein